MKNKPEQENETNLLALQKKVHELSKNDEKDGSVKAYLIGFIITFLVDSLIAVSYILISLSAKSFDVDNITLYRTLSDGFALPGVFTLLFYALILVSRGGAFDAIGYSVKLVVYSIFSPNLRETKLPKTYADYKELKRGRKQSSLSYIAISGALFFLTGLIFLIIFNLYA